MEEIEKLIYYADVSGEAIQSLFSYAADQGLPIYTISVSGNLVNIKITTDMQTMLYLKLVFPLKNIVTTGKLANTHKDV